MPLRIEGSAAALSNGPYRAVRPFFFERSTKPIDADVVVHVARAGAVGYGVPVREDRNWWGSEGLAYDTFQSRRRVVLNPLSEESSERAYLLGQVA